MQDKMHCCECIACTARHCLPCAASCQGQAHPLLGCWSGATDGAIGQTSDNSDPLVTGNCRVAVQLGCTGGLEHEAACSFEDPCNTTHVYLLRETARRECRHAANRRPVQGCICETLLADVPLHASCDHASRLLRVSKPKRCEQFWAVLVNTTGCQVQSANM